MAEKEESQIEDVDEMFEFFVKKKMRQLGIKQAAVKSTNDEEIMSKLERNMKMRLENNMASNNTNTENSHSEIITQKSNIKKNKKEKKHKKKKKKREKDTWEEKMTTENMKGSNPMKENDKSIRENSPPEVTGVRDDKNIRDEAISTVAHDVQNIEEKSADVCKTVKNGTVAEQGEVTAKTEDFCGPKKDIAAIKMKIELLKMKSEGEKVKEEAKSLLNVATQNQDQPTRGKEHQESTSEVKSSISATTENEKHRMPRRSESKSSTRKHSKSHSRRRSRSRSRERRRSRHGHRSRSPLKRNRHSSRLRDRSQHSHKSHKRARRSHSPSISTRDKVRLLEIAKANALAQHRATVTANFVTGVGQMVKTGSMSVKQLTAMCEDIASGKKKEAVSSEMLTKAAAEELLKEAESGNVHHPFAVREMPAFTIKPVKSLAVGLLSMTKPIATLSKEFPVSCGQQHRRKEVLETVYGKWQSVAKDQATKTAVKELATSDKVFIEPEPVEINLSSAIADRISATRLLQDDPNSKEAQEKMSAAQKALDEWTRSQHVIGQFTGSTGIQPMPKEVIAGGKQAWFKADDLKKAKHVGGIGKSLLQKMGWTPGTPLGKTMLGQLEPISVSIKNDRKGLSSFMEAPAPSNNKKPKISHGPNSKDMSNKHPVSALMEICSKRHWPPPDFRLVDPLNLTIFTFKVKICNDEYIGTPASNKKQAKLLAASIALQNMGLLPKT